MQGETLAEAVPDSTIRATHGYVIGLEVFDRESQRRFDVVLLWALGWPVNR
jgi:hypothetical protein